MLVRSPLSVVGDRPENCWIYRPKMRGFFRFRSQNKWCNGFCDENKKITVSLNESGLRCNDIVREIEKNIHAKPKSIKKNTLKVEIGRFNRWKVEIVGNALAKSIKIRICSFFTFRKYITKKQKFEILIVWSNCYFKKKIQNIIFIQSTFRKRKMEQIKLEKSNDIIFKRESFVVRIEKKF